MSTATRVGRLAVVVALLAAVAGTASAATYVVQADGLGDFPTIGAAVAAAGDGDIIELMDGIFTGDGNRDIHVMSRPITIRSQSGNYTTCMIDCKGSARAEHRGFLFTTTVGTGDPTLQGIGIINGYTTTSGGGIRVDGASPSIVNCAVAWCAVDGNNLHGGGMYVGDGGDPDVTSSLFSQNTAEYGGGVAIVGASGTFSNCGITDNEATTNAGGVYIDASAQTTFWSCEIASNTARRAGGVQMKGTTPFLQECDISRNEATADHSGGVWLQSGFINYCTIVENSAVAGGGGVYCHLGTGVLLQCLIAFSEDGYGVGASAGDAPSMSCCDVFDNADGTTTPRSPT